MTIEVATYLDELDPLFPEFNSGVVDGDDHLRLVKSVLQNSFPNITAAMTANQDELNRLDGVGLDTAVDLVDAGNSFNIGVLAGNHLAFSGTHLQAKTNATTAGALDLNPLGGAVTIASAAIAMESRNLIAGVGLSGGGDLSNDRTFTVDLDELTTETSIAAGDFLAMVDITDSGSGKITFANLEATLNHDSLAGFVGNEHIDHSGVSISSGNGLTGGGAITTTQILTLGTGGTVSGSSTNGVTASSHTHALDANVYRGTLGSGSITAQSGGVPSGGNNGDIILIY
jgi:hypothetical protein